MASRSAARFRSEDETCPAFAKSERESSGHGRRDFFVAVPGIFTLHEMIVFRTRLRSWEQSRWRSGTA